MSYEEYCHCHIGKPIGGIFVRNCKSRRHNHLERHFQDYRRSKRTLMITFLIGRMWMRSFSLHLIVPAQDKAARVRPAPRLQEQQPSVQPCCFTSGCFISINHHHYSSVWQFLVPKIAFGRASLTRSFSSRRCSTAAGTWRRDAPALSWKIHSPWTHSSRKIKFNNLSCCWISSLTLLFAWQLTSIILQYCNQMDETLNYRGRKWANYSWPSKR